MDQHTIWFYAGVGTAVILFLIVLGIVNHRRARRPNQLTVIEDIEENHLIIPPEREMLNGPKFEPRYPEAYGTGELKEKPPKAGIID